MERAKDPAADKDQHESRGKKRDPKSDIHVDQRTDVCLFPIFERIKIRTDLFDDIFGIDHGIRIKKRDAGDRVILFTDRFDRRSAIDVIRGALDIDHVLPFCFIPEASEHEDVADDDQHDIEGQEDEGEPPVLIHSGTPCPRP